MIRRIQALDYRCLRHADVRLDDFHVLVGPNASGKSTLLDVIAFLGDLVSLGLEPAVRNRTRNFQDLVWGCPRTSPRFELAAEFEIPALLRTRLPASSGYEFFRYEVAIRETDGVPRIESERGTLQPARPASPASPSPLFPAPTRPPKSILRGGGRPGARTILSKSAQAADNFNIETSPRPGKGWATSIAFGDRRSALGNLPESPDQFPVATHVKRLLTSAVVPVFLDSTRMREASPPAMRSAELAPDGSNLPWVIQHLERTDEKARDDWLAHVGTTLTDLEGVRVVERQDDRHAYLMLHYRTGVTVPSWMASDGALRLLALTLPAYLNGGNRIYTLEEPENGIHPLAVECVFQSLSSIHGSQVLLATHSPVVLRNAEPEQVLCFAKDASGATDIVKGHEHPRLREWRGSPDMEILFASGVIG